MKQCKFIIFLFLVFILSCSSGNDIPKGINAYKPCGYAVGQKMCNVQLEDQYNNSRLLNDLNGIKVLQFSAMWCHACSEASVESLNIKRLFESSISYAIIIIESYDIGVEPSIGDIQQWSYDLELINNVFAGKKELVDEYEIKGFNIDLYPSYYVLSNDNIILSKFKNNDEVVYYLKKHVFNNSSQKNNPTLSTSSSTTSGGVPNCLPEEDNE